MRTTLPLLALGFLVVALTATGCKNPVESDPTTVDEPAPIDLASVTQVYEGVIPQSINGDQVIATMMTGRNRQGASIKIANDNDFLYVAFEADPEFDIISSHLTVARSLRDVPQDPNGEPLPGRFVLKRLNNRGTVSHAYKIPLAALYVDVARDCDLTSLFVLAHAIVKRKDGSEGEEGVWASGRRFRSPASWATYQFYKIQCVAAPLPPQQITCEPSWAYGNQTFIGSGISSDWGWFNIFPGPGTYTRDIIGGAGENDPAKGKVVGVMTVDIVLSGGNGSVTITLEMNNEFSMNSVGAHFSFGRPPGSDPTRYGDYVANLGGAKIYTTTFGFSGVPGSNYYVTAYTESCGPF